MRKGLSLSCLACALLVGCGREPPPAQICASAGEAAALARDMRNAGHPFADVQHVANEALARDGVRREIANRAIRIGFHSEPKHTAKSIAGVAAADCHELLSRSRPR